MEAGRETLPCKIITADNLEAAWASLNENTDRCDLSEQEIANQLNLIYELVRPLDDDTTDSSPPDTPAALSMEHFETDEEALRNAPTR